MPTVALQLLAYACATYHPPMPSPSPVPSHLHTPCHACCPPPHPTHLGLPWAVHYLEQFVVWNNYWDLRVDLPVRAVTIILDGGLFCCLRLEFYATLPLAPGGFARTRCANAAHATRCAAALM